MTKSESSVASHIIVESPYDDVRLWRNNSGAFQDQTGRLIRFGLGNDSEEINKIIKSSDYIGMTSVIITPEMVGHMVGIFTAVETKPEDFVFRQSDKRAVAQKNFHDIVKSGGGLAGFATSLQDYKRIVGK